MKRKFLLAVLAIVLTVSCAVGLAACGLFGKDTHEHQLQHTEAAAATCTDDGNVEYWYCPTCGKYFSDADGEEEISDLSSTVIPAKGHDWDDWTTEKEPTCTENGLKTHECSVCHETEQEAIAATGHTFSEEWSRDETYHWHACLNCNQMSDKAEHTFENGICSGCELPMSSLGLDFVMNSDNKSYSVMGIGSCTDTEIVVLSAYKGLPVTSIGDKAFDNCSSLTSITIPNSVTSIGDKAFSDCSSLTSITIPDGVTSIGDKAFSDCSSLTSITIPDGVTSIGNYAFYDCSSLTGITIPDSVTSIKDYAFYGCTSLEAVYITDIAAWCGISFYDDSSNPLSYAGALYLNGELVTELVIPDGVTSIGNYAFGKCRSLTGITIPASVTSIGEEAFYNCTSLEKVYITDIAAWCGISFDMGSNPLYYAGALYLNGELVTELVIPDGVTGIGNYAFENCTSLTGIVLPASVTGIGYAAFRNCDFLTGVTITDGVKTIGEYAFENCSSLTSITIPASITGIGYAAFEGCYKLAEVYNLSSLDITKGSTSDGYIGYYALNIYNTEDGQSKLKRTEDGYIFYEDGQTVYLIGYIGTQTKLTLPDKFNNKNYQIYKYAFYGCSTLTSVTIPEGVTGIGNSAFGKCTSLTSITIPGSVTTIGSSAFAYCSSLTNVIISEGVTNIEQLAFYGCSSLTSITIPSSVTGIEYYAFDDCYRLVEVCNLSSLDMIKGSGFNGGVACYALNVYTAEEGQSNLKRTEDGYIFYEDGQTVYLIGYIGTQTELTLPDAFNGKSYQIYNYAFYDCNLLTGITIPDGVTGIGEYAFSGCRSLTGVTISDSVTSVGYMAFEDCNSLEAVYITDMAAWCGISFYDDSSNPLCYAGELYLNGELVTELVIPDGVTSIGNYAFEGCSLLTSIAVPASVTSIGVDAFYDCTSLEAVYITDMAAWCGIFFQSNYSNPLYYAGALYLNGELVTELVIPEGVTSIGYRAFYGCRSITSVNIRDGVTGIGMYAFYGCRSVTSITIPDSVTSIGMCAFSDCSSLTGVTIGNGVTSIGDGAFGNCTSLEAVYITDIAAWCGISFDIASTPLYYAGALYLNGELVTELVIPDGVTGIGDYAFFNCSTLTSIVLPDSVTRIGEGAFMNCSSLKSITIPDSVKSIVIYAFENCTSLEAVYITDIAAWCGISFPINYSNPLFYAGALYLNGELVTELVIPEGVTSIGDNAFYNCSSITSIIIPDGVTSIGNNAFYGCSTLTGITIPASVTNIGYSAFKGCYKLTEVYNLSSLNITKGSTSNGYIGYYALNIYTAEDGQSNLKTTEDGYIFYEDGQTVYLIGYIGTQTKLTLPDTFNGKNYQIYNYAFYNCRSLTSVVIPDSVTSIGRYAFYGCSSLESISLPFVGEKETDTDNTHFGYIFGAWSYSGNSDYIPDSLRTVIITGGTSIGIFAFYNCSYLTSVTIPDSVTSIGGFAFYNCSSLASITIPDGVIRIGSSAFGDCSSLISVTIGKGVMSIEDSAFKGCYKLAEVYNLSSLAITKGSTSNGYVAYYALNVYTSKDASSNLKTTEDGYIFYEDGQTVYLMGYIGTQTELTLPDTFNGKNYQIYNYAFYGCSSVTSIIIPDGVTGIGYGAFRNCSSLTGATFKNIRGWWLASSDTATSGTSVSESDLADPSVAATCLTSTYCDYYWRRG